MALNLSLSQFVVIFLSLLAFVAGVVLVMEANSLASALNIPSMPFPGEGQKLLVDPTNSQQGTLFLLNFYYPQEAEKQDLSLVVRKGTETQTVALFDDGLHQDKKSKDSWYGGFFDSTNATPGTYEVVSGNNEVLGHFEVVKSGCQLIQGSGREDTIKFVILSDKYTDLSEFKNDALHLITGKDAILTVEPYKSNLDKFSFFVVNANNDFNCQVGCHGISTLVCCDDKAVMDAASQCSFDQLFVLLKDTTLCGSASTYAKICAKNDYAPMVIMHELGHSVGDLADEYLYDTAFGGYDVGKITSANCDAQGCDKWKDITSGCFKGCSYDYLYRSEETNSIMLQYVPEYNLVSQRELSNKISNYSMQIDERQRTAPPQKSYFVNAEYDNGSVLINSVTLKPVDAPLQVGGSEFSTEVLDTKGKRLQAQTLKVPLIVFPLPNASASAFKEESFNFSFLIPYQSKADYLAIKRNDKVVASSSLSVFSATCGDNRCSGAENHLSCPQDCPINEGFCQTGACDPDCPSQKTCVTDQKNKFNWGIILMVGALVIGIGGFFILGNRKK